MVLPLVWAGDSPEGTLSYVGILPEHRGEGLGRRLHRAGLLLLARAGAQSYLGSTGIRNEAMARVFERNDCAMTGIQLFFCAT